MNRRSFLLKSCVGCLAAGGLSGIISSCNTTRFINGDVVKDGLMLDKSAFRKGIDGTESYHTFLVIRNEILKFPLYVYRFSAAEYVALWMQCTHQGSELQAFGDSLQCPAHGSEFNNRGNVTSGPAEKQLLNFPVKVNENSLFIDLRRNA